MEKTKIFMPTESARQYPLMVALPGLVSEDEPTRIDSVLEELRRNKIIGIRLNYVKKEDRGETIAYNFDMVETAQNIEKVIEIALKELNADQDRIGLISNSISAFPVTQYLIRNQLSGGKTRIKVYASISPLVGWNYFINKETREFIEKERIDIVINGNNSMKKKVIPKEIIPEMMRMDALKDLESYHPDEMEVMTVLGNRDRKASPDSMRRYHFILGGKEENLISLDTDHEVPNSNQYVTKFIIKNLTNHVNSAP
jgi:hypothetical protein